MRNKIKSLSSDNASMLEEIAASVDEKTKYNSKYTSLERNHS
jgi:hypothetical protein